MDLILWRHAEAEEGGPDLERKLTAKGHKHAARMAKWLQQRLPSKFIVLSSPAARARQTAAALATSVKTAPSLAPDASAAQMIEALDWPRRKGAVVLVGHQPALGQVAAVLVSGKPGDWTIRKGALWWLTSRERDGDAQVVVRAVLAPEFI